MQILLNQLNSAFLFFAQSGGADEELPIEWTMVDAILVVVLLLLALTAICKSSQRH